MKKGLIVPVVLLMLASISFANASNEIRMKSRRFVPQRGISDAAKAKIQAVPKRAHVLIQLEQLPTLKQRKDLEAKGIKLLSYIPNKAWLASIPSAKPGEIAALSNVRAITEIAPNDKISPHIIAGNFYWGRAKNGNN